MSTCELTTPTEDGCQQCGAELPGRRLKWCSDQCSDAYWSNHDWNMARRAALKRDGWQCVRCGHIGWNDVPHSVLPLTATDKELDPFGTRLEDWAIALGLLDPDAELWSFAYDHHSRTVRAATDQLPEVLTTLVDSERKRSEIFTGRARRRYRPGAHELEVNHIEPRRGRGYHSGCHHHLENLETLCRPCHTDETNRQRRGLPGWREDPTPIGILMGQLPIEL